MERIEVLGEMLAVRLLDSVAEAQREEETVVEMERVRGVRDAVVVGVESKQLAALGMYV